MGRPHCQYCGRASGSPLQHTIGVVKRVIVSAIIRAWTRPPCPLTSANASCGIFGLPAAPPPSLDTARHLLRAWTRIVPWESASRIMRRAQRGNEADCALIGESFWQSHFEVGSGGTCYESNYALWGLMRWLGYEGYLTLNNMGESIACHSAIVLRLDGRKWLLDVGLPLHALIPLDAARPSAASSPFMDYRAEAESRRRYEIWRSQPAGVAFTLVDEPVADAPYRRALTKRLPAGWRTVFGQGGHQQSRGCAAVALQQRGASLGFARVRGWPAA